MQIDEKLIAQLENISYLTLLDDEKSSIKAELQEILDSMALFNEINTENLPSCSHLVSGVSFRDDEVYPSFDRELILKNAPVRNDEMFIAPKTVE
jgi:aspartyl-tRNA(Asn)/glutamyl-tRNA(Gln) amidotransferase subunit C